MEVQEAKTQEGSGNQPEESMLEENYDDPGEREDDDYYPDEDGEDVDSEDGDTSGSSDEEYTPSPATTVDPPKNKVATGGRLLMQGGEISEYEKIRAANIKQREEFLKTLQLEGEWQDFKESEGLMVAAGRSQKRAKELKVVEREPVKTRRRESTGKSSDLNEAGVGVKQPAAGQVAKKGSRAVLVNCQECGEEVRKALLKTHIKFYHPKIQKASAGRGSKSGQDFPTWEDQRSNIAEQSTSAVGRVQPSRTTVYHTPPMASPENIEREWKEQRVVVDSLFANIQISSRPTSQPMRDDVKQRPVAGWGGEKRSNHVTGRGDEKRTYLLVTRGDQRANPVARNGDQRSNPIASYPDQLEAGGGDVEDQGGDEGD